MKKIIQAFRGFPDKEGKQAVNEYLKTRYSSDRAEKSAGLRGAMGNFWDSFEKKAWGIDDATAIAESQEEPDSKKEEKKAAALKKEDREKLEKTRIKSRARSAQEISDMTQLGTIAGTGGAYLLQRMLGKRLVKTHEGIPFEHAGKDIKNLTEHFSAKPKESPRGGLLSGIFEVMAHSLRDPKKKEETEQALKEIGELGDSFIKKHKLRESGITFNAGQGGKLGDYYNPIKNTVNMNTASPAVALHEMGHAADYRGNLLKTVGRHMPAVAAATAVPLALAYGDAIKDKIKGEWDDKLINFIQENPALVGLAGYTSSTLYPEFKASYLATKHLKDVKGSWDHGGAISKTLGPAYGTYLAGAIPIIAGYSLGKYIRGKTNEKHNKDIEKKKRKLLGEEKAAAMHPTAKAFLVGGALAGIPSAALSYYLYGTKGGKHLRSVSNINQEKNLQDQVGYVLGKKFHDRDVKAQADREKHPLRTALLSGGLSALLGGGLTALGMHDMDVVKKGLKK